MPIKSCKCGQVKVVVPDSKEGKLYRVSGVKCGVCGTWVPDIIFRSNFDTNDLNKKYGGEENDRTKIEGRDTRSNSNDKSCIS